MRRTYRRVHRARAGLLGAAVIFCALLALAAPRPASRTRPLKVQQPSAGAKAPTGKKAGGKSSKPSTRAQSPGSRTHRAAPRARRRSDEDNPDPATMVRARSHRGARTAPRPRASRAVASHISAAELRRRAAAQQTAQLAASIEAGVLRSRAQAQAQAQMLTRAKLPAPRPAPAALQATPQAPAPVVRLPAEGRGTAWRRVDGFGAEGSNLAAGSSGALAARPQTTLVPPSSDDPVLEALAHPSRNDLTAEAVQPEVLPSIYAASGHLPMPAPLRGSHDVLVHQNTMADDEGLSRIRNEAELNRLRAAHLLVDLPQSESLHLNPELPANRRCARPWTVRFATDMARAFYARFHEPLQVNSAVRTVAYQLRLQRVNGNAAAVEGEGASPHLTGQAIDIGKRGMSAAQLAWMRAALLPLMNSGKIDVEEEFLQSCFHISVYRSYLPAARKRTPPRTELAQLHRAE